MNGHVVPLRRVSGHYAMARGWMDNCVFGKDPLCKRAAWVWLIEHAAYRPHTVRFNGQEIVLKRGQLIASVRHLATEWGWAPTRVHRFLKKLNRADMIETASETASETAPRFLTICNYDKYQAPPTPSETASETAIGTREKERKEYLPYGRPNGELPSNGNGENLKAIIFGQCLTYLKQSGVEEKKARSLLGKWRKEHGEGNVIEIASEASKQGISEPVGWIEKALRVRHGPQEVAPL